MAKNRIKELRKFKDLTLAALAEQVNEAFREEQNENRKLIQITDSQLSQYENWKRSPRYFEVWEKLAEILDVSVLYLLGFIDMKQEEIAPFETGTDLNRARKELVNNINVAPVTKELSRSHGSGVGLNFEEKETIKSYKERAMHIVDGLSDNNNDKWIEYGRLLLNSQIKTQDD